MASRQNAPRKEKAAATAGAPVSVPPRRPEAQAPPWLRFGPAASAVLGLYLLLRLVYLWQLSHQPIFAMLMGDSQSYDRWACQIAAGDWIGRETFFQSPLYPYFLAAIYSLVGRDLLAVRLIQILLGAAACWFLMQAGRSLFSKGTGLLAGALLALYPTALFHDLQIQKTILDLLCIALLLRLCALALAHPAWFRFLWIGAVLGALGLNRENALLLLPGLMFWAWRDFPAPSRMLRTRPAAAMLAGAALVLLPVGIRNYAVGGELLLTTSQFGYNFFIGNSRGATGIYRPLTWEHGDWRYERQDAIQLAERDTGRSLTPSEVSRYWLRRAIADMRADPAAWAALTLRKARLLVNAVEINDTESEYAHRHWSAVLRWLGAGFHFGVLFPLAAAGACAARGNGRRQWLLHLIFGVYGFSLVLFYLFSRYRFPLVPILTLWAAVGILLLVEALHSRRWPALLGWSAVLLAAAALSNWRITPVAPMVADTYYNLACGLEEDGREGQAEEAYRQALEHNPAHLMALNNLGYLHQRRGDLLRALEWYGKALQIDPGLEKLQVNLGMTYGALGRTADAIRHYRRAIGINPRLNPAVYFNLACMHARRGENGEALLWLRRAASHGFTRRAALLEDPDLASLRQEAEFRAILEALPAR